MNFKEKYKFALGQIIAYGFCISTSLTGLISQEIGVPNTLSVEEILIPEYVPSTFFVVDPFPRKPVPLIQSLDSVNTYKGILEYNFGLKSTMTELSRDWSTITISETIGGQQLKIPFTSSVEWYIKMMQQQKWHTKLLEIVHSKTKDDSRKGRGQMLEVVGVDIGRLGRASLQVSGNVNINGKMVFQDQELVRSTLNETQNTHLEFDQKQNLNIQGKIGDRITVAMDQDSERQFEWENNIRISYEGHEDDIVQKVEAGNISLSLPSTKYVTFSGKNQGLFGIKAISKLGPVDITTIASIEKSKKEQSEWEGGGQSSTQQIRDVDWSCYLKHSQ